jgi:peptidoglycan-N-acetylmuramic acid deacetylase
VDRRGFLLALAAGTLVSLTACRPDQRHLAAPAAAGNADPVRVDPDTLLPSINATETEVQPDVTVAEQPATPTPSVTLPPTDPGPAPLPTYAVTLGQPPTQVQSLPGAERTLALTIDDGISTEVVKAYLDFIEASGVRLTFFVNGCRPSWTDNAPQLRKLVETGQVQLASHTWSHPDITTLSNGALADELRRNEAFLNNTFGVTAKPFFRPPFGFHNNRTDRVCADHGLTPIVMWYGSFGDSGLLTEPVLLGEAQKWLGARRVVLGHANQLTVTHLYPQILELIRERQLQTLTLDDAFYGSAGRSLVPR